MRLIIYLLICNFRVAGNWKHTFAILDWTNFEEFQTLISPLGSVGSLTGNFPIFGRKCLPVKVPSTVYSASTHFAHFQMGKKVVRNGSMVRNGSRWCEMGRFLEFRTSIMKNDPFSLILIRSVGFSHMVTVLKS